MSYGLVIGNKNLSSWSLRPWVLMRHFDIPFKEVFIRLDTAQTRKALLPQSPSGMVPCLQDEEARIWDSLAICEYLAEKYPEKNLWPEDFAARALARSMVAQMHSGFGNLRTNWPMCVMARTKHLVTHPIIKKELEQIFALWEDAHNAHGGLGPFLFGEFTIADAFYAPIIYRIRTYYHGALPETVKTYIDAMLQHPEMLAWEAGAQEEIAAGWYE